MYTFVIGADASQIDWSSGISGIHFEKDIHLEIRTCERKRMFEAGVTLGRGSTVAKFNGKESGI